MAANAYCTSLFGLGGQVGAEGVIFLCFAWEEGNESESIILNKRGSDLAVSNYCQSNTGAPILADISDDHQILWASAQQIMVSQTSQGCPSRRK